MPATSSPVASSKSQGTIVPVLTASVCGGNRALRQLRRVAKIVVPHGCARLLRLSYVEAEARVSAQAPHSEGAMR